VSDCESSQSAFCMCERQRWTSLRCCRYLSPVMAFSASSVAEEDASMTIVKSGGGSSVRKMSVTAFHMWLCAAIRFCLRAGHMHWMWAMVSIGAAHPRGQ
jgi:hypothetical protein